MKLLLDAMMPEEIAPRLLGHNVTHVASLGWQELRNGELLSAAESEGFSALITKDRKMPYQQNLRGRRISLLVLRPTTQDIDDLLALVPIAMSILEDLHPGSAHVVAASNT